MRVILVFILSFLPRVIQNPILNLFGFKIAPKAKIGFCSLVWADELEMKNGATIKPFSVLRSKSIVLQENAIISSLTLIKCTKVELGAYAKISPFAIVMSGMEKTAVLTLGKHSQIFPFCWIEPGQGVFIGDDTGIGGHTLIFTHGSWSDFMRRGPVKYAPVHIGNHVWLPWRVFIMPGVSIGDDAIIAAGSVLSSNVEAGSLYGGMPAKLIKADIVGEQSPERRLKSAKKIVKDFIEQNPDQKIEINNCNKDSRVIFYTEKVSIEEIDRCLKLDLDVLDYQNKNYHSNMKSDIPFCFFVRKYGIRLSVVTQT